MVDVCSLKSLICSISFSLRLSLCRRCDLVVLAFAIQFERANIETLTKTNMCRINSIYIRIYVMMMEIKLEIRDRDKRKWEQEQEQERKKLCHIFLSPIIRWIWNSYYSKNMYIAHTYARTLLSRYNGATLHKKIGFLA